MSQSWHFGIRHVCVLAKTAELQQDTGQSFLAMVEKLIAEVVLQSDVAGQQCRCEFFRKLALSVKSLEHDLLLDSEYGGRFCCRRRAYPDKLTDQASFAKKLTRSGHRQYCFLALPRDDTELHLARLNKIDRVRLVSLRKDWRLFLELQYMFANQNAFEQALDIRIDFYEVELCDLLP